MTTKMNRVVLARRPSGDPVADDFRLESAELGAPGEGEVLVRVTGLSLDPYMRGRMDDAESYADPVQIGDTMEGGTVGIVEVSNDPKFAPGDGVFGMLGWASHGIVKARALRKLDRSVPMDTALGVLGMPGFTAYAGVTAFGSIKEGETLVVAAATGPVGSMVGQLAKARGARVVGVAGGPEKCKIAVEKFGFDACIDHRAYGSAKEMREALRAECPKGIDVYFENVGGQVLGGVLPLMNLAGRIIVCGMIAWYSGASDETGDMPLQKFWRSILVKRLQIFGLLQNDHVHLFGDFIREVAPKIASGEIAYLEDIADGLEGAPAAFQGMLKGRNVGKQIVRVSEE